MPDAQRRGGHPHGDEHVDRRFLDLVLAAQSLVMGEEGEVRNLDAGVVEDAGGGKEQHQEGDGVVPVGSGGEDHRLGDEATEQREGR